MLATINNTVNSASVQGNQLYDPYGNNRYQSGSMTTSKGFTGQYNDNLTGLDYYGSRYYDPAAGVFLSADPLEGDLAGANPYEYVNANPETNTDPTGGMVACGAGCGGGSPMPPSPEPPSAPSLPGGTGGGISNGNSSPCGDPTNSSVSCAKTQLAAKTDWQTTVQLPTHIGVSNGSMLCHPTGNGFAISAGIGWGATLTATSAGNGCYSSGNGDATGTTTVTVRGSGLAPMTACFSFFVNCSDEGAKNGSGSGEGRESGNWLAADTGEEGDVGNGPSVGGDGGDVVEGPTSTGVDTKPDAFKMTNTVMSHFEEFRPRPKGSEIYEGVTSFFKGDSNRPFVNSPGTKMLIDEIMQGPAIPDPRGYPNALRWDEPGFWNSREGTWQLVVDMETNTVIHFNFVMPF